MGLLTQPGVSKQAGLVIPKPGAPKPGPTLKPMGQQSPVTAPEPKAPVKAAPVEAKAPEPKPEPKEATPPTPPADPSPRESAEYKKALTQQAKLRQEQQDFANQKAAYAKQQAADKAEVEAYKKALADAKRTKGKSLLNVAGLTFEQLAAAHLSDDDEATPSLEVAELRDQVAQIEKARQADLEAQKQAAQAQYDHQTKLAAKQLTDNINAMVEKYPLTAGLKKGDTIAQAIISHYNKTGQIYEVEAACASMEADLAKVVPADLKAWLSVPALRDMIKASLLEAEAGEESPTPVKPAKPKAKAADDEEPKPKKKGVLLSKRGDTDYASLRAELVAKYQERK